MKMEVRELIDKIKEFFELFYFDRILEKARKGEKSFQVDFSDLLKFDSELGERVLDNPEELLKCFDLAVKELGFELKVRFFNLPLSSYMLIRNIRSKDIGKFVAIEGVVRQKSDVRPQVTAARFECPSCGNVINVLQLDTSFKEPNRCSCGRKGRFRLLGKELVDAQGLVLEELPEHLEGGEQPKRVKVFLKDDLVSPMTEKRTNPGSRIVVIGVIKEVPIVLRGGVKSTRYDLMVEANNVEFVEEDFYSLEIAKEEEEQIRELAKDEHIYEKLVESIAPSIYGYEKMKEALVLQLFGGVRKTRKDGVVSRGDIHILLIGDPGAGKSALLKRMALVAPKARYVSGKGATGAGLCVGPDSFVITNSGCIYRIEKLVEEKLKGNKRKFEEGIWQAKDPNDDRKVLSLDKDLKLNERAINQFWKIKVSGDLIRLITQSGKELIVTPETKLLTLENGVVCWKKAKSFKEGDCLATAREIGVGEAINDVLVVDLIESNPLVYGVDDHVKKVISIIAKKFGSKQEAARKLGLNEDWFYAWSGKNSPKGIYLKKLKRLIDAAGLDWKEVVKDIDYLSLYRGRKIKIPYTLNKEFLYFAGLVAGDGDLSKRKYNAYIRFSNNSEELIRRFLILAKKLFNVKCNKSEKSEKRAAAVRFSSKIVFEILNKLGIPASPKSEKIDLSNVLLRLPNELVSAFLSGLFDSDGYVVDRKTRGSSYVGLVTTSKILAYKLQLVLLRFGVHAKIRKRSANPNMKVKSKLDKYEIEIKGKENLEKFEERIGFKFSEKKTKLRKIIEGIGKSNTNIDLVPGVQDKIIEAKICAGISSRQLFGYKISSYSLKEKELSRTRFQRIANKLNNEYLKKLAYSDIFWEKIKRIEVIRGKIKYVYDLTVDDAHNFLVNGFIVHNTASVTRDEFLKGWSLEAGAMVLANGGLCAIDELDKMSQEDRAAMHEGLENQTITISKATIQATLIARTTVLAAANPKFGRFDPYDIIAKQIDLPPTLINRFDLIFPVKDLPEEKKDELLAGHILKLHQRPDLKEGAIPTRLLRKYIAYARQKVKPVLSDAALEEIKRYYVEMRNKASDAEGGMKAIPISPRQLEALVRLAEASAKVRLSDKVERKDARRAIDLLHYCLTQVGIDPQTGKIDIDKITTGVTASQRSRIVLIKEIIEELENRVGKQIPIEDVLMEALKRKISESDVEEAIEKLKRVGDIFEPRRGFIQRI